ncbi:hydrogenase maturation nickel metallochaperone HypA [Peterkaempfera griseoplana]|uniref:hydrogenase maturation nickel metallochaperone HypA n=1 Tax=Peterkaempfera griseoplana TaxID=66896 RepID=UPI0006E15ACA|nr:hydrogenase maturation nickel metallochaperone HypA [Peterkaempfera griseoplana]
MHELSIAVAVVEAVEELAREHGADRTEEVRLRIGTLAGVEPDALRFSFTVAQQGTVLEGARLVVEQVQARARCASCRTSFVVGSPLSLHCPGCDAPAVEVTAGRELDLAGVRFAEPAPGGATTRPNPEEAAADVPCH